MKNRRILSMIVAVFMIVSIMSIGVSETRSQEETTLTNMSTQFTRTDQKLVKVHWTLVHIAKRAHMPLVREHHLPTQKHTAN